MTAGSQMSRRLCVETKSLAIIPSFSNRNVSRENSRFRNKHFHYIGVFLGILFARHILKLHNTCWRQPCCKTICHVSVDDATLSLSATSGGTGPYVTLFTHNVRRKYLQNDAYVLCLHALVSKKNDTSDL